MVVPAVCSAAVPGTNTVVTKHDTTVCIGRSVILTSDQRVSDNETYRWIRIDANGTYDTLWAETNRRLVLVGDAPERDVTYICEVVRDEVHAENNLMANGDFESSKNFTSDYQYVEYTKNDANYYEDAAIKNHPELKKNLYTLTKNSYDFWRDYQVKSPHGGQYFALFDAGKEGFAWKAYTKQTIDNKGNVVAGNPQLKLEKDSTYLFSYWAAHPNPPQYSNSPARLQFVIVCKHPNGQTTTYKLNNTEHTLGQTSPLNAWELREERWTAPVTCDDVMIGVYDANPYDGVGNDFCLDDIMFQKTTTVVTSVVYQTIFYVKIEDCTPPCDPVDPKRDSIKVCKTDLPYKWVYDSKMTVVFDAPGVVDTVLTDANGCVTAHYILKLDLKLCNPECPDVITVSDETTVCENQLPFIWKGYQFAYSGEKYEYMEKSPRGCDSIWHSYTVYTKPCNPPCYEGMVYAKWDDVIFCDNASDRYVAYQWYCDSVALPGETRQFLYFPTTGGVATHDKSYYVCAQTTEGTTECSCEQAYVEIIQTAITAAHLSPAEVLYFDNRLIISVLPMTYVEARVFSAHGCLLAMAPLTATDTQWHLPLNKGVYLVALYTAEGARRTAKIVVR